MKWFIPFLAITLSTELFANYTYYVNNKATVWMYNLLNPITHTFYTYIFYKLSESRTYRRLLIVLNSTYIASYIIFYTVFSDISNFNNYLIAVGGIQQVLFACLYFYQYFKNDSITQSSLWIATGVMIFYSGVAICFALYNFIKENTLQIAGLPLYNIIPRTLSIILYSCLSVSFITWRKSILIKQ